VSKTFDVVFVLSFFSHMLDRTSRARLARLFDLSADDG